MREELHDLVDRLPESELRPAMELIHGRLNSGTVEHDLPFFASFEADPTGAEQY